MVKEYIEVKQTQDEIPTSIKQGFKRVFLAVRNPYDKFNQYAWTTYVGVVRQEDLSKMVTENVAVHYMLNGNLTKVITSTNLDICTNSFVAETREEIEDF